MEVRIIDLIAGADTLVAEIATMLMDGFRQIAPTAFPTTERAVREIREALSSGHISRVALDEERNAVGWIGGSGRYASVAWELHPLVVRPDRQGRGIGRALVSDFEQHVVERGGLTIFLGTDDEQGQTSLSGVDLYPDVWPHLLTIKNLRHHPYGFLSEARLRHRRSHSRRERVRQARYLYGEAGRVCEATHALKVNSCHAGLDALRLRVKRPSARNLGSLHTAWIPRRLAISVCERRPMVKGVHRGSSWIR
jgi:aminoglycoside 6'-N-acetyltransferase I